MAVGGTNYYTVLHGRPPVPLLSAALKQWHSVFPVVQECSRRHDTAGIRRNNHQLIIVSAGTWQQAAVQARHHTRTLRYCQHNATVKALGITLANLPPHARQNSRGQTAH
jgi:hypothetical protein